jgi:TonB family protein
MNGSALLLVFNTIASTIPSLSDVYCRSQSVVVAMATAADFQADSNRTQMNGTEFRVVKVVKGPLEPGQSVYSIDWNQYSVGSHYLVFLRRPTASELATYSSRPATHTPVASTRVAVTASGSVVPVRAGEAQIPTEIILPGADLVSTEKLARLRAAREPFPLPVAVLESTFGRYRCSPHSEDPQPSSSGPLYVMTVPPPSGTVELIDMLIDDADRPDSHQHLTSHCPIDFAYPAQAMRARLQGTVVLRGTLSDGGHVRSLWVAKGVNPLLDRAALNGVSAARLTLPLVPDGSEHLFSAIVRFRLQ